MHVCVCVCVSLQKEGAREGERGRGGRERDDSNGVLSWSKTIKSHLQFHQGCMLICTDKNT